MTRVERVLHIIYTENESDCCKDARMNVCEISDTHTSKLMLLPSCICGLAFSIHANNGSSQHFT